MIRLVREGVADRHRYVCGGSWPLKVTAYPEDGVDADMAKVFVYRKAEEDDPYGGDMFSNVASMHDMDSIAPDEPVVLEEPVDPRFAAVPFYRVDTVEMNFLTADAAERAWRIICHDVRSLVREYKAAENLREIEEISF